ncbi:MAG: (2Fe-2S) ferredoxin domain-containing protein [Candidatus Zixiibacteriota bacterium]|nr:MAG: (2Fe-2S) ferredoxin domain-containing protein [candidate division Zixibacteria bacterium]
MPKLTIQDLARVRNEARQHIALREGGEYRARITVHMGTCGIAAGARDIMKTVLEEIEKAGAADLLVTTSGCGGLCSHEPMATVELTGETPVKYIDLDPEKTRRIFRDHMMEGHPVLEYALAEGSERRG